MNKYKIEGSTGHHYSTGTAREVLEDCKNYCPGFSIEPAIEELERTGTTTVVPTKGTQALIVTKQ